MQAERHQVDGNDEQELEQEGDGHHPHHHLPVRPVPGKGDEEFLGDAHHRREPVEPAEPQQNAHPGPLPEQEEDEQEQGERAQRQQDQARTLQPLGDEHRGDQAERDQGDEAGEPVGEHRGGAAHALATSLHHVDDAVRVAADVRGQEDVEEAADQVADHEFAQGDVDPVA